MKHCEIFQLIIVRKYGIICHRGEAMTSLKKRLRRSWLLWLLSKVLPWLLVVGLAASIRIFLRVGITAGPSMEPTLHTGDIILVARWIEPKEGDIVAARAPGIRQIVCKRVAGIQGDEYYLLGDNSSNSYDSRDFGLVSRDDIIGVSVLEIRLGGLFVCVKSSMLHWLSPLQ